MADLSVSLPRGISVSTASDAGGSGNEIAALMKHIAQLQKQIKKLVEGQSGDPKQKAEQLKLMQSELTLQNQALARLLDLQARQGKNQDKASGLAAAAAQSAIPSASSGSALHLPAAGSARQTQQGQESGQASTAASSIDTYV